MNPPRDSAQRCPLCGGPAQEVAVSVGLWRGGLEPITITACEDPGCDAYYVATSRDN